MKRNAIYRWAVAVAVSSCCAAASGAPIPSQGTWTASLQGRDLDGNLSNGFEAYYDSALGITWLDDVKRGVSREEALSWVQSLTTGGFADWRLPQLSPVNGTAFQWDFSTDGSTDRVYARTGVGWGLAAELGHLYYVSLGNKGICDPDAPATHSFDCALQVGYGLVNSGPFVTLDPYYYWYGTDFALSPTNEGWYFNMGFDYYSGAQASYYLYAKFNAIAVRDGDVYSVPEPAVGSLLAASVVALLAVGRRRAAYSL
jgi:hypothetical protein